MSSRRPSQKRRPARLRGLLFAALLLAALGIGIAIGMALHDNPRPGGTVTTERTLELTGARSVAK